MPQCNIETNHPMPRSPEEGYQSLATAVLLSLVHDLEGGSPTRRKEARASVAAGVPEFWLDLLSLGEAERGQVLALFTALSH